MTNKRIRIKKTKKQNTMQQQMIVHQLRSHFTIQNQKYKGSYLGPHSICHFQLNETPH